MSKKRGGNMGVPSGDDGADERWNQPWGAEYGEDGSPPAPRAKKPAWRGSEGPQLERRKIDFTRPWDEQDGIMPPADLPPSSFALGAQDRESIAAIIRAAVPDVRFAMVSISRPFPGFKSVVIIGMAPASAA